MRWAQAWNLQVLEPYSRSQDMSERGNFRGGGHRGRGGDRGGRGGRGGGASGSTEQKEKPKKENIIDLNRFLDQKLKVKFNGGREGRHTHQLFGMSEKALTICSHWHP
jgi:hypothetical protein